MKTRIFKASICISGILFLSFLALSIYTWSFSPNTCPDWSFISPLPNVHIAVTKNWGGNLVFFNLNRPYTGSIIGFSGDKTVHESGVTWGGVYYRSIRHYVKEDGDQWTLMFSLWYPVAIFGILLAVTIYQLNRSRDQL